MAKKQVATSSMTPKEPTGTGQYTVVARRYRPQQFKDLVGQEAVARALENAIKTDRVAHAYLFTGARGVGKTSAARILAKALNCVKGATPTPCDQCEICLSIASGEDIDVLEIDGASNRGIDEVRAIRQNVSTRPSRSRYKIYIIDEVHMLTTQAFNALLKTLEEPPPHVKFIFATTEVQKIPITILSRCQRFDFGGIGTTKIVERLRKIVQSEKMQADDEALQLIARRAGGSMRDAQSLLDQLLAFGGEKLSADQVHALLGTAGDDRIVHLAQVILEQNARQALAIIHQCADEGLQLGELLDQLIDYWRSLMLVNSVGSEGMDLNVPEGVKPKLLQQASELSIDTILSGLDVLTTTKNRLRNTSHGLILLEMTVIRLCRLRELIPIAQLSEWLSQPQAKQKDLSGSSRSSINEQKGETGKKNSLTNTNAISNGLSHPVSQDTKNPPEPKLNSLSDIWEKVVKEVGGILGNHLEKAFPPAISAPNALVIRFPVRYNSAYDYCKETQSINWIVSAFKTITGSTWAVRIEREEFERPTETLVVPKTPLSKKEQEKGLLEIPLLNAISDVLGGQIRGFDEGFGMVTINNSPEVEASETEEH
jgi:DNA polymerase III subunit gamma/tau